MGGARGVNRRLWSFIIGGHQVVFQKEYFNFLAADVRKHVTVDLHAGTEHLAAFLNHFLALIHVIDDIAIFEWEFVFAKNGADTIAPTATGFEVGDNFRFIHRKNSDLKLP
ncbi:MAG: hypothetical protein JWM04_2528 [Verrucomicrobiales bacterium]|nr:hypothetical protein [Verrucomicrobiales bacterium]